MAGVTYFLSVQSAQCSEWIPIEVVSDEGNNECNVFTSFENGELLIVNLTSDANTKLFDADFSVVWSCDPWNESPCTPEVLIPDLDPNATYFLSVESENCQQWLPLSNANVPNIGSPNSTSKLESYSFFPNPTTGESFVRIDSPIDQQIQLDIFDMTGTRKLSKPFFLQKGNNTVELNVDVLSKGIYNITITNAFQESRTIRFLKN